MILIVILTVWNCLSAVSPTFWVSDLLCSSMAHGFSCVDWSHLYYHLSELRRLGQLGGCVYSVPAFPGRCLATPKLSECLSLTLAQIGLPEYVDFSRISGSEGTHPSDKHHGEPLGAKMDQPTHRVGCEVPGNSWHVRKFRSSHHEQPGVLCF